MNVDPKRVKELVLIFSELDEEYQKQLLSEAYKLQLMQGQKNHIQKAGTIFKTDKDLQEEIEKKTYENVRKAKDLLEVMDKMNDTDKAALFMMVNQLAYKSNTVKESDITITVHQKEVSMREYLEKHLTNVDYDKAKEKVSEYLDGIQDKK